MENACRDWSNYVSLLYRKVGKTHHSFFFLWRGIKSVWWISWQEETLYIHTHFLLKQHETGETKWTWLNQAKLVVFNNPPKRPASRAPLEEFEKPVAIQMSRHFLPKYKSMGISKKKRFYPPAIGSRLLYFVKASCIYIEFPWKRWKARI